MPIFEYACQDCGNAFELLVRSDTVPQCPSCHSAQLDKQLSVFATAAAGEPAMAAVGPCGSCGHPDGPGPAPCTERQSRAEPATISKR